MTARAVATIHMQPPLSVPRAALRHEHLTHSLFLAEKLIRGLITECLDHLEKSVK